MLVLRDAETVAVGAQPIVASASSMFPSRSSLSDETRSVRPASISLHSPLALDEAHAHAGLWAGLTGKPVRTGPRPEAPIVLVGVGTLHIAMRAPAIEITGSCKLGAAAQLRAACETAREVGLFAVAHRRQDIAAADLIAEEMRRRR